METIICVYMYTLFEIFVMLKSMTYKVGKDAMMHRMNEPH